MTDPEKIDQEDPLSAVETEAVANYSIFAAYCKAGFQRSEAMEILLALLAQDDDS